MFVLIAPPNELFAFCRLLLLGLGSSRSSLSLTRFTLWSLKMGFGLYSLLEAGLLVVNAIAILNEERFLNKSKCDLCLTDAPSPGY